MVDSSERVSSGSTAVTSLKEELEELALAGRGWHAILRRLSQSSGRRIRLVGVHGGLLAASDRSEDLKTSLSVPASGIRASDRMDEGVDASHVAEVFATDEQTSIVCTDGFRARVTPVHAGARRIGLLLMEEPISKRQSQLLDASRLAVAIEAVRRDAEAKARAESASRLIDELRFGSLREPEELVRAAERFGIELEQPHAAAVFAYDGPSQRTWSTAISWIEMPVRSDRGLGWTVLTGDIRAEVRRIRARLQGIVGDRDPVLTAAGPLVKGLENTPRSFREAEIVLAMLRRRSGEVELIFESLGLTGLLLSLPRDRLEAFVDRFLGPILDRDDLLTTLAVWYKANGSRAAVASRLNVHRNSVGYRIARIKQKLGLDPLDSWVGPQLQAGLACREVLTALTDLTEGGAVNGETRESER